MIRNNEITSTENIGFSTPLVLVQRPFKSFWRELFPIQIRFKIYFDKVQPAFRFASSREASKGGGRQLSPSVPPRNQPNPHLALLPPAASSVLRRYRRETAAFHRAQKHMWKVLLNIEKYSSNSATSNYSHQWRV